MSSWWALPYAVERLRQVLAVVALAHVVVHAVAVDVVAALEQVLVVVAVVGQLEEHLVQQQQRQVVA